MDGLSVVSVRPAVHGPCSPCSAEQFSRYGIAEARDGVAHLAFRQPCRVGDVLDAERAVRQNAEDRVAVLRNAGHRRFFQCRPHGEDSRSDALLHGHMSEMLRAREEFGE